MFLPKTASDFQDKMEQFKKAAEGFKGQVGALWKRPVGGEASLNHRRSVHLAFPDPLHIHRQWHRGQPAHPGILRPEEGGVPCHPPDYPGGWDDQVQARERCHHRWGHHRLLHAVRRGQTQGERGSSPQKLFWIKPLKVNFRLSIQRVLYVDIQQKKVVSVIVLFSPVAPPHEPGHPWRLGQNPS